MKKTRKKKKGWFLLYIGGMISGFLILLVPFAMDQQNQIRNRKAISVMTSVYDRYEANRSILDRQIEEARAYNEWLAGDRKPEGIKRYEEQLSFDGGGVMGYLFVPAIDLKIRIYHGTEEETLAAGAGHLFHTSLPVGGDSSHSVITAHSGMPSMRAFDDIRKMKEGDLFAACIYGQQFVYEVTGTEIVLPYETESLCIRKGEDRMTLVTCTPYGINDHRLLVHGIRTMKPLEGKNMEKEEAEKKAAARISSFSRHIRTAPLITAGIVFTVVLIFICINFTHLKRKKINNIWVCSYDRSQRVLKKAKAEGNSTIS